MRVATATTTRTNNGDTAERVSMDIDRYDTYIYIYDGTDTLSFFVTVSAESPLIAAFVAQKMNAGVCGVHVSK